MYIFSFIGIKGVYMNKKILFSAAIFVSFLPMFGMMKAVSAFLRNATSSSQFSAAPSIYPAASSSGRVDSCKVIDGSRYAEFVILSEALQEEMQWVENLQCLPKEEQGDLGKRQKCVDDLLQQIAALGNVCPLKLERIPSQTGVKSDPNHDHRVILPEYNDLHIIQLPCVHQGGKETLDLGATCGVNSLYNVLCCVQTNDMNKIKQDLLNSRKLSAFFEKLQAAVGGESLDNVTEESLRQIVVSACCEHRLAREEECNKVIICGLLALQQPDKLLDFEQSLLNGFHAGNESVLCMILHTGSNHWVTMIADRTNNVIYLMDSMNNDAIKDLERNPRLMLLLSELVPALGYRKERV
jgi:hypothetical protein